MVSFIAVPAASVLLAISLLHLYWAVKKQGAPGIGVPSHADGSPVFVPSRTATVAVSLLLALAAFLLLERSGLGPGLLPPAWRALGTGGLALVLLIRGIGDFRFVGLFKRERSTAFARIDTWLYTPLVLVLSAAATLVTVLGH